MTRRIGSSWNPPAGYREAAIGGTLVVAREGDFDAFVSALGRGTLHAWASAQPGAKAMQGRGIAWATALPGGTDVVVRHSRHGGMLAPLTQDLFLAPTRAPEELAIAERLRSGGVRTPEVVGYAVYSVAGPLCRADVVTARVVALPLPEAMNAATDGCAAICKSIGTLIRSLTEARAIHPDLNARNVLIESRAGELTAWMIDVDRVTFGERSSNVAEIGGRNTMRLAMSLKKLHEKAELRIEPGVLSQFFSNLGVGFSDLPRRQRSA
jgi:tRNA A-37 threonylcarbamoyl transferase component Bud32